MATFVAVFVPETKNKSLEEISMALGVGPGRGLSGKAERQPLLVNAE